MSLKIFILSPLERTSALRQGFQPLSDYRFNVKLTPMGIAVSRLAYASKPKKPDFFPFLRLHGVFWAKTRFLATRASSDGDRQIFTLNTASPFQSSV
jgi:hypothetical protein